MDALSAMLFESPSLLAVAWTAGRITAISLGIVSAVIALVLYIASRTKWGQNKPLTKCITLAVLAHVWLLMYAYGTRVHHPGFGPGKTPGYSNDSLAFVELAFDAPIEEELTPPSPLEAPLEPPMPLEATEIPVERSTEEPTLKAARDEEEVRSEAVKENPNPLPPGIAHPLTHLPSPVEVAPGSEPQPSEPASSAANSSSPPRRSADQQLVPEVYQLRFSESRSMIAGQYGGDPSTEAAVEAALRWLAVVQEGDGSWNAAKHGAGRETRTMDRDRQGTGSKADTGMTALALLSFLGAGYTHERGPYTHVVANGLAFLLNVQMPSGDLAGSKQIGSGDDVRYARMYCHGMATLALGEAYAMTGDQRLLDAIQRAAAYTLKAQNPQTGGWRYQVQLAGDPGDLSQFGWQAMALSSCEHAGLALPSGTRAKLSQFLDSVAAGRSGGLAVYRPLPNQRPTPAMTAEALAMRALLEFPLSEASQQEAKGYLLQNLPGRGEENLYYWYYATIALFQHQDEAWRVWNAALKEHLTRTQVVNGPAAGSWDPLCIWAGYGGRIYSTTLSCLCLEVYYRYLPLYQGNRLAKQPASGWR